MSHELRGGVRRLLILVSFCTCSTVLAEIPTVTVCQALREYKTYVGGSIIMVGRLTSTDEGIWLSEDCKDLFIDGKSEQGIISLLSYSRTPKPPPLPTRPLWKQVLLANKLQQVKMTTRLRTKEQDSWYAAYGRFEKHLVRETGDDSAEGPRLVVAAACRFGPKGCVVDH